MSCYAIVKLPLDITASPEDLTEALAYIGQSVREKSELELATGLFFFTRDSVKSPWNVINRSDVQIDKQKLVQAVARSKTLAIAKAQGYGNLREEKLPDGRIVIRARD